MEGGWRIDDDRSIWVRGGAFVRLERSISGIPQAYRQRRFGVLVKSDSRVHDLYIRSSTLEEAITCLDFLAGQDYYFKEMVLSSRMVRLQFYISIVFGSRSRPCSVMLSTRLNSWSVRECNVIQCKRFIFILDFPHRARCVSSF
jgi:hypothetical protein